MFCQLVDKFFFATLLKSINIISFFFYWTGRTQETIHQYASDIHDSINQFASDIGLTQLFEPWFELIEDAGEQLKAFSGHQGLDDFVTQTLQLGFAKVIAKAIFVGLLGLVIFTCLVLFS